MQARQVAAVDISGAGASDLDPIIASTNWQLSIHSAYFYCTVAGTNAASATSLILGKLGDTDYYAATCNLPASVAAGSFTPFILLQTEIAALSEVIATHVTLALGPTGMVIINYGVASQGV
jgi:hypothetical protein